MDTNMIKLTTPKPDRRRNINITNIKKLANGDRMAGICVRQIYFQLNYFLSAAYM